MLHPKQQRIKDIFGKEPETLDEIAQACIAVINARDPVLGFAWDITYDKAVSNSHDAPITGYTNWGGRNRNGNRRTYPGFSGRVWIRYADECKDTFGSSHNFDRTLTYTGTGGGGTYNGLWDDISAAAHRIATCNGRGRFEFEYPKPRCFSWDYRFFLDDFPSIQKDILFRILSHEEAEDKKKVWSTLHKQYYRNNPYKENHRFVWEDPETKAKDEAFIKIYEERKDKEPA